MAWATRPCKVQQRGTVPRSTRLGLRIGELDFSRRIARHKVDIRYRAVGGILRIDGEVDFPRGLPVRPRETEALTSDQIVASLDFDADDLGKM